MCLSSSNNPSNPLIPNTIDILSPLIPKTLTKTTTTTTTQTLLQNNHDDTSQNDTKNIVSNNNNKNNDLIMKEAKIIAKLSLPMVLTALLLYSRSLISMLFLGRLGDLSLAGGSLAIGFANITGYSVLSGLAIGMEPICGQAFGAKRFKLLGLTLQRTTLLLLLISLPIAALWLNIKRLLIFCNQRDDIASEAQSYILYTLPDLLAQSILHPMRIYLRSQSITLPLTFCAAFSIVLHIPINYLLVCVLKLGIKGVALSAVWTNFNLVGSLMVYVIISRVYERTWCGVTLECLRGWKGLLGLAVPSCVSVCLEWWWYEAMVLLCGLLADPQATVASMGILIQTTALMYIFPSSLSFGVSTRVGNELGASRPSRARAAARAGVLCSFALGLTALLFTLMVRNVWAGMFTRDGNIVALTSMVLPIIGLCELGNCPQTTGCGVLRGTARPSLGANVNLGCFYLVGMPVAIWLSFYLGFGFKGLWLGLLAAQVSCLVTMMVVLGETNWEAQAKRAKELINGSLSDFVTIDDGDDDDNESQYVVEKLKKEETLQQQQQHCSNVEDFDDSPV